MSTGFIARCKSPLDGAPLIVVLTRGSVNPKTGDVIQSWILREDVEPREALDDGRDVSICGHCVQRPSLGGRCYVRLHQGPQNIWRAAQRGSYRDVWADAAALRKWAGGRPLRLGSYGDPAMVRAHWWRTWIDTIKSAGRWTGFTHQWRYGWALDHMDLCMASVETADEAREAHAMGWRTFRTVLDRDALLENEFVCPASKEMGKRLDCRRCAACHGNPLGKDATRAGSVIIREHGPRSRAYRESLP